MLTAAHAVQQPVTPRWHSPGSFAISRRPSYAGVLQLILRDFVAKSVSMDSQHFRRLDLIASRDFQYAPQESFFEFGDCILEKYTVSDHLVDQTIEAFFH